jgi:glycerol-3-phosphate dehydrogenase (NAD(P)+)
VLLWAYEPDVAQAINTRHSNPRFLPGASLARSLRSTSSLEESLDGAEMVTYVTPSHVLRAVSREAAPHTNNDATLVVASKGIERGTLRMMSEVVREETGVAAVVALSGPSFAAEVAQRQPTAVVAASTDHDRAVGVQLAFSNSTFRVYTHDDELGVELGGALKNVMAIATGLAEGLGLGHNPRAALITRGLAEITRLACAAGAQRETLSGLSGLGDLTLTCFSTQSRNRQLGERVGRGEQVQVLSEPGSKLAEGVPTARSAFRLARRLNVETPIIDEVHAILYETKDPRRALVDLLSREVMAED